VTTFATFECTQEGTDGKVWWPHLIPAPKRMYVIPMKTEPRDALLKVYADYFLQWICRNKVDQLNLHVKGGYNVKCITFDGRNFSSGEVVESTWGVDGQSKSHVTVFRIAPKEAPFDVLFGRNFLSSGEVDFDSEKSPIQIGIQGKVKVCPFGLFLTQEFA
jgi:hypothetical protein